MVALGFEHKRDPVGPEILPFRFSATRRLPCNPRFAYGWLQVCNAQTARQFLYHCRDDHNAQGGPPQL